MGRILRKKPAGLKKKKRQNDETASTEPGREVAPSGAAGPAMSGEEASRAAGATRKPQLPAVPAPAAPADNLWNRSIQFLREVKIELKKVTWPTRKQTLGSTGVVIVLVMIISMFLGLVDMGLAGIVRLIFN